LIYISSSAVGGKVPPAGKDRSKKKKRIHKVKIITKTKKSVNIEKTEVKRRGGVKMCDIVYKCN
jgi:hypothetical protein